MTRVDIFTEIEKERGRQAAKWGGPHAWGVGDCSSARVDTSVKVAVLAEELGEVARATLDAGPYPGPGLRDELIQLAAVCVAWLEAL